MPGRRLAFKQVDMGKGGYSTAGDGVAAGGAIANAELALLSAHVNACMPWPATSR